MDGAEAGDLDWPVCFNCNLKDEDEQTCRRAWGLVTQPETRVRVKQTLVQILVVVATIQMRPLKTEVEQGSM